MVQNISNKSTLYEKTSGVHPKLYLKDKFIINKSKSFCLPSRRRKFDPWVGKIPWRREWQPTPVFFSGEFRGSLAGYSPCDRQELYTTEGLLLLLLSRFSRVQLCVTPQTAAHQAPPSLGFSRQEHWSGLLFPSPMRESEVTQSCLTLSDPMDCSPPGSSVHGILQARVLEWGAITFSVNYSRSY